MKIPLNKIEEVQLLQREYNQTVIKIKELMDEEQLKNKYRDIEKEEDYYPKYIVKDAVAFLIRALKEDEGYYISWKANIAMAFQDEYNRADEKIHHDWLEGFESVIDIHEVSNKAADNFLKQLMG